jgi:hypothetical protein
VQGHPTVDHQVLPGDEPGQIRAEKHDDVGDVLWFPDAPRGRLIQKDRTWSGKLSSNGEVKPVLIMPGETALTLIAGAYSSAAVAVRAATPAFDAAYGASPADGRVPLIDAVLTMLPPPRASITGAAARMPCHTPVRLTLTNRSHSSGW